MKIRNALYVAGAILVAAAITSLFEQSELIWSTILVLVAIGLLVWGYRKDRQLVKACLAKKPSNKKIGMVTAGVTLVFLGLGLPWANLFIFGRIFNYCLK